MFLTFKILSTMKKMIKLFVIVVAVAMLTIKCGDDGLSPEMHDSAAKVYPSGIMVFKTQAEFVSTLDKLKNNNPEQLISFAKSSGVKTLFALLTEAKEKQAGILANNQGIINEAKLALERKDEAKAQGLVSQLTEQLNDVRQDYEDIIEFNNNTIQELKYKDGLMSAVLNRDNMVIVEGLLLHYSNDGITSLAYENESSLTEIKTTGSRAKLNLFPRMSTRDNGSGREDVMAYMTYSKGSPGNPYSYYNADFRVVNTYVAVWVYRQVWYPETCVYNPDGSIKKCYPGHWGTVYELDHYDLTNTRVSASIEARNEMCAIVCWDTGGYVSARNITLTGPYLNATISETDFETSSYWDIGPHEFGEIHVLMGISFTDGWNQFFNHNVEWGAS
jgi:uncharacterized protein YsxB (DUF464 family)